MPDFDDRELDNFERTEPIDRPLDGLDRTEPIYRPEAREPRSSGPVVAAVIGVALLVGAGAWYAFRQTARSQPKAPVAGAVATTPGAETPAQPAADPLPPLDQSDALVRELAARLGAHPQLARWLVTEELARRFVASVVNVAEGTSPGTHLRFLAPEGAFDASNRDGRWYADPSSFRRYDLVTDVFDSLDPAATAALFERLHPLFDAAYAEIGNPASSFDATLALALGNLLRVPIPEPPVELVPQGIAFAYADRTLEERTVAEKHLLRLGPDNALRVQAKLRALAGTLGIEPR